MAVILTEGFELVADNTDLVAKGWNAAEGTRGSSSGRFGAGYTLSGSASDVLSYSIPFIRYVVTSFHFKTLATDLNAVTILAMSDSTSNAGFPGSTTAHLAVDLLAGGTIRLIGDFGNIVANSPSGIIQPATWHHIEILADINAGGTSSIYVDGFLAVTATGDFIDGSSNSAVVFAGDSDSNVFSDIVIQTDASSMPSRIGEHKIQTLLPDANTAQADWTGVFTDIDDPFGGDDGDTTFINSTALNAKSEFALDNLADTPDTIIAVNLVTVSRKTDAGTKGVTPYIESNATREDGVEFAATETYGYSNDIIELDPDGSVAWDAAAVNALLVGVEITT